MNCNYCNSRIFDSDRTCPRCGAPILIDSPQIKSENIHKRDETLITNNEGTMPLSYTPRGKVNIIWKKMGVGNLTKMFETYDCNSQTLKTKYLNETGRALYEFLQ